MTAYTSPFYQLLNSRDDLTWLPWNSTNLTTARESGKPILLFIGNISAYWSYRMIEETFGHEKIRQLLADHFVCLAADREVHPDLDYIYGNAVQAMTGRSGNPLTLILNSDLKPFFGGTYFPVEALPNLPPFETVLTNAAVLFSEKQEQVNQSANQIFEKLKQTIQPSGAVMDELPPPSDEDYVDHPGERLMHGIYGALEKSYDPTHGGFNKSPKFPLPANLRFLIRYFHYHDHAPALAMALETAQKMIRQPIYDRLGGGFHRYSEGEKWDKPAYEKLLNDNCALMLALIELYQVTDDPEIEEALIRTMDFLQNSLQSPFGGFYNGVTAYSTDEEEEIRDGYFYTWGSGELGRILGADEARAAGQLFRLHEIQPYQGRYPLGGPTPPEEVTDLNNAQADDLKAFSGCLAEARSQRKNPGIDRKMTASGNALALSVFCRAYQILEEPAFLETAQTTAQFILDRFFGETDSRSEFELHSGAPLLCEDYAHGINALIDFYEVDFNPETIRKATALTETMVAKFYDADSKLFRTGSALEEILDLTVPPFFDNYQPAAQNQALLTLARLAEMTNRQDWLKLVDDTIERMMPLGLRAPQAMPFIGCSWFFRQPGVLQASIAGSFSEPETKGLLRSFYYNFTPNKVLCLNPGTATDADRELLPLLKFERTEEQKPSVYLCQGYQCETPIDDPQLLEYLLCSYSRFEE